LDLAVDTDLVDIGFHYGTTPVEPTVTPPPEPTKTPTPQPSATPEPTVTPDPTATPGGCPETGVVVEMPAV